MLKQACLTDFSRQLIRKGLLVTHFHLLARVIPYRGPLPLITLQVLVQIPGCVHAHNINVAVAGAMKPLLILK